MRTSEKVLNPSLKKEIVRVLVQMIADLKDAEEVDLFFRDFLTNSEYDTFSKRLAVAYWLRKKRSYNNIKDNLGVSSATIATVQQIINKEGMKLAIQKIEAEEWANQWSERIKKYAR